VTVSVVAGLAAAYVLGSSPFAWVAGRLFKGVDLRAVGSGNLGATNVYRALGAPAAVAVLLLDAMKGALPVLRFPAWFGVSDSPWFPAACGVLAIVGHVRPYGGLFRGGGKGVATTAGVFGALAPQPLFIGLGVFLGVVALTRYVSLGSLLGSLTMAGTVLAQQGMKSPVAWAALGSATFVLWTHRANIDRLRRGVEPRFGSGRGAGT
jgi:acyl phosphate:glycerol-3-phosphate acyltransferase